MNVFFDCTVYALLLADSTLSTLLCLSNRLDKMSTFENPRLTWGCCIYDCFEPSTGNARCVTEHDEVKMSAWKHHQCWLVHFLVLDHWNCAGNVSTLCCNYRVVQYVCDHLWNVCVSTVLVHELAKHCTFWDFSCYATCCPSLVQKITCFIIEHMLADAVAAIKCYIATPA